MKPKQGESKSDFITRFMGDDMMISEYPEESQRMAVANSEWKKKEMSRVEETKTFDISDVEIFSVGKWNGDEYTQKDLDELVLSYKEIGHRLKPFLKLGHDENQELLQKDGLFSAGWVTDLYTKGGKLYAKFSGLPEKIYKLLKAKAYKRVSSEIFWNLKDNGKTYKRALKAVALLGSDTPAVTSLSDILELYTETDYDKIVILSDKEHIKMDELKVYKDQINDLETELKVFKNKSEDLTKENTELKSYIENVEKEKKDGEINNFLENAVKDKKILPAQKESFFSLAQGDFENVKNVVDSMPVISEFSETSEVVEIPENPKESQFANEDLDSKIKKYMADNKVGYTDAFNVVALEVK